MSTGAPPLTGLIGTAAGAFFGGPLGGAVAGAVLGTIFGGDEAEETNRMLEEMAFETGERILDAQTQIFYDEILETDALARQGHKEIGMAMAAISPEDISHVEAVSNIPTQLSSLTNTALVNAERQTRAIERQRQDIQRELSNRARDPDFERGAAILGGIQEGAVMGAQFEALAGQEDAAIAAQAAREADLELRRRNTDALELGNALYATENFISFQRRLTEEGRLASVMKGVKSLFSKDIDKMAGFFPGGNPAQGVNR